MARSWGADMAGVLRGLQCVLTESAKLQQQQCQQIWLNSSVRNVAEEANKMLVAKAGSAFSSNKSLQIDKTLIETLQRASMVLQGVKGYVTYGQGPIHEEMIHTAAKDLKDLNFDKETIYEDVENIFRRSAKYKLEEAPFEQNRVKIMPASGPQAGVRPGKTEPEPDCIKVVIVNTSGLEIPMDNVKASFVTESASSEVESKKLKNVNEVQSNEQIKMVNSEIQAKEGKKIENSNVQCKVDLEMNNNISTDVPVECLEQPLQPTPVVHEAIPKPTAKKPPMKKQILSKTAKQRRVPSSRLSRLVSFGGLAAGLGVGTVAEVTRRTFGWRDPANLSGALDSVFLTPANAERIVDTLCKVRGAALKIGQILSIQDNNIISPQLQQAFERVRQSADFMPSWQVEKVMASELGADWRSKLASFNMKPFAAASIGQVHHGVLHDGMEVAMKIQYPGVARGIESDIDNLVSVMKIWNIFPQGLFIDNIVEVAKRELAWEVDYIREAECTRTFKKLLEPYPEYHVPKVINELSTQQVFTTELIEGVSVDKCVSMDLETRKHICNLLMQLCLRELFEFRYMQTDPNWANFFYNEETRQLVLLDFGATRSYDKSFMDKYIHVIKAAADSDRQKVLELSRSMGFLTGYDSKLMEEAHVDTVMILSEVFSKEGFDFGGQDTTLRIQRLVPVIVTHRLCPPPEEIYSLHRKLSGVFLLCSKLKVKIDCWHMFNDVFNKYKFS